MTKLKPEKKLIQEPSIFLEGELIDLCAPDSNPETIDNWFRWFNTKDTTTYLYQGIYPNTFENQQKFLEEAISMKDRIITLILPKNKKDYVGVASLSNINFVRGECHFALVIGDSKNMPFLAGMEAKSLLTEHAFEVMGMNRISSGQACELKKWQRMQILLGYQIEGIARQAFRKGMHVCDAYISSCLREDYIRLKEIRGGKLWPGREKMLKLIRTLPKDILLERTEIFLNEGWDKIWDEVTLI